MNVKIDFPTLGRMFMLPTAVADEHLKLTDGEHLKVIISAFCNAKSEVDTSELAAACGVSEQKVKEALIFYTKLGVIKTDGLTGAEVSDNSAGQPVSRPDSSELKIIGIAEPVKGTSRDTKKDSRVLYSPKEIAQKLEGDEQLYSLKEAMEQLLAKPLTRQNIGDLLEMYEHMELEPACILMIAEYCKAERGKTNTAYILTVAQDWFSEGISDFEQIERKIIGLTELQGYESRIKAMLGLQGSTTKKQRQFFEHWNTLGFGADMVRLAYEDNMDRKNTYSLAYMNKTLENWAAKGITNAAQAEAAQAEFKANSKQAATPQNTGIDLNEFEAYANNLDLTKLIEEGK